MRFWDTIICAVLLIHFAHIILLGMYYGMLFDNNSLYAMVYVESLRFTDITMITCADLICSLYWDQFKDYSWFHFQTFFLNGFTDDSHYFIYNFSEKVSSSVFYWYKKIYFLVRSLKFLLTFFHLFLIFKTFILFHMQFDNIYFFIFIKFWYAKTNFL